MEEYREGGLRYEKTRDAHELIGKRVLGKRRAHIGKVNAVQLDGRRLSGIVVRRGLLRKKTYIGEEYIERLAEDAVLLTISPAFLERKRKILTSDGKQFATITSIQREKHTNTVKTYHARRRLRNIEIPASEVKHARDNIILKKDYEQAKNSLTP